MSPNNYFTDEHQYPYDADLVASVDPNGKNFICNCLGGYLVKRSSAFGNPLLSFVCKDITQAKIKEIRSRIEMLTRSNEVAILSRGDPAVQYSENMVVFNFCIGKEESLRQFSKKLVSQNRHVTVDGMMTKLVKLLVDYKNCLGHRNYEPLNSLSVDTVYIKDGKLFLLPIMPIHNTYPEESPAEVYHTDEAPPSLDSDISTCAYIAVKVASGCDLFEPERNMSSIVYACLNRIRGFRPDLGALERELLSRSPETTAPPSKDPPDEPEVDPMKESSRTGKTQEDPVYDYNGSIDPTGGNHSKEHGGRSGIFCDLFSTVMIKAKSLINVAKFDPDDGDSDHYTFVSDDGLETPAHSVPTDEPTPKASTPRENPSNTAGNIFRENRKDIPRENRWKSRKQTTDSTAQDEDEDEVDPFNPFSKRK